MIYELYYDRSDNKFRHIQIGNIGKLGEIAIEQRFRARILNDKHEWKASDKTITERKTSEAIIL